MNQKNSKAELKSGNKFVDIKANREINIEKVDLKGVHVSGLSNPISLTFALRSVKDRMWLPKN